MWEKKCSLNCQCPNDIIQKTGYIQDKRGYWFCKECYKNLDEEYKE